MRKLSSRAQPRSIVGISLVASVAGKMLLSQNQKRMNTVRGTGRNRREEIAQNDTGGEPTKQDLGLGKLV